MPEAPPFTQPSSPVSGEPLAIASLSGLAVLVTRPQAQASVLATHLQGLGAHAYVFPAITICDIELSPADLHRIGELDRYAGVICISAHAAEIGLRLCADRWPQWPLQQTWYAVGPASGRPLQGWGLNLVVAEAGSSSETLLAMPSLQNVNEQRFLIFRGRGGRETLAESLRSRGAQVDYLELYERQAAQGNLLVLQDFLAESWQRVVIATSGESLDHLIKQSGASAETLRRCSLIVVSGRLAEYARHHGFTHVHVASGASDEALTHSLTLLSTSAPKRFT